MRESFFMNLSGSVSAATLERYNHPYYTDLPERNETIIFAMGNKAATQFSWPEHFYRKLVLFFLGGAFFTLMACLIKAL